jgi:hypothetical protein
MRGGEVKRGQTPLCLRACTFSWMIIATTASADATDLSRSHSRSASEPNTEESYGTLKQEFSRSEAELSDPAYTRTRMVWSMRSLHGCRDGLDGASPKSP